MSSKTCESSDDETDLFCPALPPHLLNNINKVNESNLKIVGPSLPKNYDPSQIPASYKIEEECSSTTESEEDENLIGPILPNVKQDSRFDEEHLAFRADYLKSKKESNDKLTRETWMLELPDDKPNIILGLGLGPRQFKKKASEKLGDRSGWTDTPIDKERKSKFEEETNPEELSIEDTVSKKRDETLTNIVQKFTDEKRSTPLIESHGTKRKKEKDSAPASRRHFNREDDMNVNKFDEAQKANILKKSRQLNDRFSSGNRKFL